MILKKHIETPKFQYFWTAGCQMLALNFQTNGLPMQMNDTLFEENGRTGYVLKDDCLTNPHYKMTVYDPQYLVANRIEIKVISGQFLELLNLAATKPTPLLKTQVVVELYDLPQDTLRNHYFTGFAASQNFNTVFTTNNFEFKKVIKPRHAMIHLRVINEHKEEIGQRFLPVHLMRQGYRHITLRNRANRPMGPASLFIYCNINIFTPDSQAQVRKQFMDPLGSMISDRRKLLVSEVSLIMIQGFQRKQ